MMISSSLVDAGDGAVVAVCGTVDGTGSVGVDTVGIGLLPEKEQAVIVKRTEQRSCSSFNSHFHARPQ
jgi:hypothetical protein